MSEHSIPHASVLILGSGVFGLSTLHELLDRPAYRDAQFTIVSPTFPAGIFSSSTPTQPAPDRASLWPLEPAHTSSVDTTRIVRADYADPVWAKLAQQAQELWRSGGWGEDGRYHECGLLLTASRANVDGTAYVAKAMENMQAGDGSVQGYKDSEALASAMNVSSEIARGTGDTGYVNRRSGWADAGATMAWLFQQIELKAKDRVKYVAEAAVRLLANADGSRIAGAHLSSGSEVRADVTVLATGAWTPLFIDLRGVASTTGQCVGYIDVSDEEATQLKHIPVHLNLGHGCFVFPPTRKHDNGGWEVKVAKHAYGYINPTSIPSPVGCQEQLNVSLPAFPDTLPKADEETMRSFLEDALPGLSLRERSMKPRMCWYLDTLSGDYLVCWHPDFGESLVLATGGSGHAFKMVPVLGQIVADLLERKPNTIIDSKTQWPGRQRDADGNVKDPIWCQDGSRGGPFGMTIRDALKS